TEQKTKNAKNAVSSILTAFLKPHRQHFVLPPPLLKNGRHNSIDFILAWFRGFIDRLRGCSEKEQPLFLIYIIF
ncbi:hypothetical protein, partial [Eubacterium sp.]